MGQINLSKSEHSKLWKPCETLGVELFDAVLYKHNFLKHMHEGYTIGINNGGLGVFRCKGTTWYAKLGSLNLINPGQVHTGKPSKPIGWIYRDIYLEVSYVVKLLDQLQWNSHDLPCFTESVVDDGELNILLNGLFELLNTNAPLIQKESLVLDIIAALFLRHTNKGCKLKPVGKEPYAIMVVKEYLNEHYYKDISIDKLSEITGLSPYYLIRSFRRHVGLPPHSYQNHIRLLKSKQALLTTKPIVEIAVESGFYDQSHFSRYFKNTFGVSPGQFRKSNFLQYY